VAGAGDGTSVTSTLWQGTRELPTVGWIRMTWLEGAGRMAVPAMRRLLIRLAMAGLLAGSGMHPSQGATGLVSRDVAVETKDGLLTATFSDRTDDAALAAAVPELIDRGVQAISLRGAPVQTIAPLAGLNDLRVLDLRGTQVRDVTSLAGLARLQSLDLQFLRISDMRPLAGLAGLRSLNLCGTEVSDLTPLAHLADLRELVLSVTRAKNLTPLIPLRQLTLLDLGSTRVNDVRALSGMTDLRFLSLNGTAVADLRPLQSMVKLQHLDLGGTPVSNVAPLAGLRDLRELDLESTQVADVRPLAGLTGLRRLSLGGSRVSDLSPLGGLPVAPLLGVEPQQADGDAVLFWNDQANRAIQATKTDPFMAARALALESIAVLDTIQSLRGEPAFLVRLPEPGDLPVDVAVAAAAHAMLSHLFPVRQAALDAALAAEFAHDPGGLPHRRAIEFGRAVAAGVIAMRDEDGWNATAATRVGTDAGQWRPTPPDFLPALDPQWADLMPFAMTSPGQFRPAGPPAPGSGAFRIAKAAVAGLGAANSTLRTREQTEIAHYWSDAIGTYASAGHWNAITASIVGPMHLGLTTEAAVFAELNVAIADAAIAMADAKYTYWFWRPVTAIRAGDEGDAPVPGWTPLLETPNHPSYVSGHSSFSGAAAVVLTKWFGVRPFTFSSASLPGVVRSFSSFEQAAQEAAISRLYGGIHFPFDNTDGLATGRAVGAWTLAVFQRGADDRGPFIMVDGPMAIGDRGTHGVTGCVLDNLSPVPAVMASLDDGPPVKVAVDDHGLFALPSPLLGAAGRHKVVLAATSMTGRSASVRLEVVDRAVERSVMLPETGK